jgi:hypothetical protein
VKRVAWIVGTSLFVATLAFAQPTGAPGAQPPRATATQPAGPPAARLQQKLERIKKRIRALRAYTLTEELQLDGATAGKLFPVLARYDDAFDKLLVERGGLQNKLGAAASGLDPKAADSVINDAVANQRAFWQLEDKRLDELRKILTPQQTAKLLIVLPPLERRIENQLRQAVQGNKGRAAIPDDGDDDDGEPRPRRAARPE